MKFVKLFNLSNSFFTLKSFNMLNIFQNLFGSLQANEIKFCNWKDHHAVKRNLLGDGDLDLFIPLIYKDRFEKISKEVGLIKVKSYQADHEYIEHYYGFDVNSSKFAHLHVYYKIVTGEHISKNYILPLDKYILNNLDDSHILPLINDKGRRSIFLIRYFLKIGTFYGVAQYLREKDRYTREWESFNSVDSYEDIPELKLSSDELNNLEKVYESSNLFNLMFVSINLKKNL